MSEQDKDNIAPWKATILSLYPEMFPGPLGTSLAGRAMEKGLWSLEAVHIRDFAQGKHRNVDDTPSGGGAGMVLRPDVIGKAIDHVTGEGDTRPRILLSPRGKPLTQEKVRELKEAGGAILLCGRFEGVDQRVIDSRELEEISIGDYILSGGELGAMVLMDAVVRLLPGVMGKVESGEDESFESGLLEYPHYTRPTVWEDQEIPEILTSGHHGKIAKWRKEQSIELTRERRPDLYAMWAALEKQSSGKKGKNFASIIGESGASILDRSSWARKPDVWSGRFDGLVFGTNASVIFFSTDEAGKGPQLHRHPYDEVFIIRKGKALFTVDGETIEAEEGQIVFAPANMPHKFESLGPDGLETIDIHVSNEIIQENLEE